MEIPTTPAKIKKAPLTGHAVDLGEDMNDFFRERGIIEKANDTSKKSGEPETPPEVEPTPKADDCGV